MNIEVNKENEEIESPLIGVYDVKLKVSDGVRFGFGFGLGMIIWSIIFFMISAVIAGAIVKSASKSFTNQFLGTSNVNSIQNVIKK